MIDTPQITQTATQLTAIIRLTIPRAEIRNVMGPGIGELMAAVAAQHRWEKCTGKMGQEFRFKVGWCDNQQQLPRDTSGWFRFFGTTSSSESQSRYLFFERLDARAP
jgi:hypothetical protein